MQTVPRVSKGCRALLDLQDKRVRQDQRELTLQLKVQQGPQVRRALKVTKALEFKYLGPTIR